ncbi:DNA-directed RNA polymerase [Polyangium aurulentum]|uniref:DNA-directed RNA polymerase n=1 Tax=Polyangium aurulentum TaxID=2567896 RepID=UPI0010AE9F3C|nr:DNA-directed RNA polymerase [Polyangium aurulentum]UQA61751.1 DNA-directed RNA polymerase [Polyangium aurulentum]
MESQTRPSLLAALAFTALALVASGCRSFVPFTHEIRNEYHLTDAEVRNLQFYVSSTVTLRREIESGGRQVTPGHKLLLVMGKTIEEVVIPAKTPGVAVKVTPLSVFVSFEPGTSLEFTIKNARISDNVGFHRPMALAPAAPSRLERAFFGQTFAQPPDPFPGNSQVASSSPLLTEDLGGNYWLATDSAGNLFFANKAWETVDDTSQAHLLIDTDQLEEVEKKRTVLPGVRLQNP